jgi:hypothetical protein
VAWWSFLASSKEDVQVQSPKVGKKKKKKLAIVKKKINKNEPIVDAYNILYIGT